MKRTQYINIMSGCAGLALLAAAPTARAQSIDYGGLQELFGEPVTTSATGKPQRASEAPVAMDIITADDIRRSGGENLAEVLSRLTGLVRWQSTRSWSDVGMRGQNASLNPSLLVLVNGRQVYIDTYGYTDWAMIPVQLEEIRQIEVVKGPNTALFGANAVSGVINIVTYNPKYDDISEAGATAGTGDYGKVHGVKTMNLSDTVSLRISGSMKDQAELSSHSKSAFATSDEFQGTNRIGQFNLDSLAQLNDSTQLRLEGSHVEGDMNDMLFSSNVRTEKRTSSYKGTLTRQTDYGLVEGSLYQNRLTWLSDSNSSGPLSVDSAVTVAHIQDLFKLGSDHSFRLLGEYRHNYDQGPMLTGEGATFRYDQFATSGMWNWAMTPEWEMTNALRLDTLTFDRAGTAPGVPFSSNNDFDKTDTTLGANSGLVWKATGQDTFRISYARGIQIPSLIAAGLYVPVPGAVLVGNPRLKPTVVNDYEFGYDRKLASIDGKFRGSLYYKKSQDIFGTGANIFNSGGTLVLQSGNIGSSATQGAEMELSGKLRQNWSWSLGYTYQTTNDDFIVNNGTITVPIAYEDTFPHHIVNAHLGWASGPWEADLYGQAASNFKILGDNPGVPNTFLSGAVDSYQTVSSRVAYRFENDITLALTGADLLQQRTATNPGLEANRQVYVSVSRKF